jgi:hypothetical protein
MDSETIYSESTIFKNDTQPVAEQNGKHKLLMNVLRWITNRLRNAK